MFEAPTATHLASGMCNYYHQGRAVLLHKHCQVGAVFTGVFYCCVLVCVADLFRCRVVTNCKPLAVNVPWVIATCATACTSFVLTLLTDFNPIATADTTLVVCMSLPTAPLSLFSNELKCFLDQFEDGRRYRAVRDPCSAVGTISVPAVLGLQTSTERRRGEVRRTSVILS